MPTVARVAKRFQIVAIERQIRPIRHVLNVVNIGRWHAESRFQTALAERVRGQSCIPIARYAHAKYGFRGAVACRVCLCPCGSVTTGLL
jgi:hypothetical protein